MGKRKNVKLEDIANATGVSIVTVSNALYGKKGVSENVRNKVIKEAERQGYKVRGNRGLENQKIIRFDIYDLDSSNINLNDISKIIVKIINARGDEYRLLGAKNLKDFGHKVLNAFLWFTLLSRGVYPSGFDHLPSRDVPHREKNDVLSCLEGLDNINMFLEGGNVTVVMSMGT